jgi:hypothetical protein
MTTKEKPKRVPTSLRVISEMLESAKKNCMKAHGRVTPYGSPDEGCNTTQELSDLVAKKAEIIKKISKRIEDEAVKKFGKEYGLIIVPLCRRNSSSGDDRLEIDLKVKKFPGCEKEIAAFERECESYRADMKKFEDWHMEALQAVAKKEEFPALPEVTKAK